MVQLHEVQILLAYYQEFRIYVVHLCPDSIFQVQIEDNRKFFVDFLSQHYYSKPPSSSEGGPKWACEGIKSQKVRFFVVTTSMMYQK